METVFCIYRSPGLRKNHMIILICYNIQETLNSWPLLSKGLSLPLMQQPPELITLVNACVYASCAAARLRSGPETALHGALLKIDILRIMASAVAVIYLKITHSFIVYFYLPSDFLRCCCYKAVRLVASWFRLDWQTAFWRREIHAFWPYFHFMLKLFCLLYI